MRLPALLQGLVAGAACAMALSAGALPSAQAEAKPAGDAFEAAFPTKGEPRRLHFTATYEDARGRHELQVWRDAGSRLHRRTDDRMDLFVLRRRDGELQMTVLDHQRRMLTEVSRTAMYQVGHPVDWFSLAHGLAKPAGEHRITRLDAAPAASAAPTAAACRWSMLQQGERQDAICWSDALRLPLRIVALQPQPHVVWNVTRFDTAALPAEVFSFQAAGYVRVNADQDIRAD